MNEYPRAMRTEIFMSNVSLARIMYGSSEGPRSNYGPHAAGSSLPAAPSRFRVILTAARRMMTVTLESLLHKAWEALSAKR